MRLESLRSALRLAPAQEIRLQELKANETKEWEEKQHKQQLAMLGLESLAEGPMVQEVSERALMKTIILATNPAKWLQT